MQPAARFAILLLAAAAAAPVSLRSHFRKAGATQLLQGGAKSSKDPADPAVDWATVDTVSHDKEKGGGYLPGSPLYDKQGDAAGGGSVAYAPALGTMPTDQDGAAKAYKENFWTILWAAICQILFWVIVGFIFLRFFRGKEPKLAPVPPHPMQKEFTFNLFSTQHCFGQDMRMCLCAWCCLPIRWADTVSDEEVKQGKLMGFWPALLLFVIPAALYGLTGGLTGIFLLGVVVYYRQQLRKRYGFDEGSCSTVCLDVLAWWCCSCCSAVQEARQVKYTPVYVQEAPAKPAYQGSRVPMTGPGRP